MIKEKAFKKLLHLLSRQLETQSNLLALEESKKNILIEGNIDELHEIIRQQSPLILSCSSLENQREQIITEMGLKDIPFRQVIEQYASAYAGPLQSTFEELVNVLHKLKKVNDLNKRILQSRLSRIKQCLSILGAQDYNLTYDSEGRF